MKYSWPVNNIPSDTRFDLLQAWWCDLRLSSSISQDPTTSNLNHLMKSIVAVCVKACWPIRKLSIIVTKSANERHSRAICAPRDITTNETWKNMHCFITANHKNMGISIIYRIWSCITCWLHYKLLTNVIIFVGDSKVKLVGWVAVGPGALGLLVSQFT